MFSTFSMAGSGLVLLLLNLSLNVIGHYSGHPIVVPQEQLQGVIDAGSQILALVLLVWGQVRRPDLVAGLVRK